MASYKDATHVISAHATQDGDGVNINRIAGSQLNPILDPFLLVDEIRSADDADYMGGFPQHPHRGFQTLTYMIEGGFEHRDSMGNRGAVNDGGLQWMSAARGVVHAEMPLAPEGKMHGYQFWINLPASHKMDPPDYKDLQGQDVPVYRDAGSQIKALLGKVELADGRSLEAALQLPHTPTFMLDAEIHAGGEISLIVPADYQVQVLIVEGKLGDYGAQTLLHYAPESDDWRLELNTEDVLRVLVFGGQPLREPIAQYGPFVMNTSDEVQQALRDFREGRLLEA